MMQNYEFVGNYTIEGKKIQSFRHTFLITRRLKPTPKQAEYFLLDKATPPGRYISSLYELESTPTYTRYKFEYNQILYFLELNPGGAIIDYLTKAKATKENNNFTL